MMRDCEFSGDRRREGRTACVCVCEDVTVILTVYFKFLALIK
jgi:hypothetical protein